MNKKGMFFFGTISLALLFSCANSRQKILMIPREGSLNVEIAIHDEALVMSKMLQEAGYIVIVATDSGKVIQSRKLKLIPKFKLSEISSVDYCGIIMPCMNAGSPPVPKEAIRIVQEAVRNGIPIAAQRGSVLILGEAGVWNPDEANIPETELYREYGGSGVYAYGKIVTSGVCPYAAIENKQKDGTIELTKRFIELLRE